MLGQVEAENLSDAFAHPLLFALERHSVERYDQHDAELRIGVGRHGTQRDQEPPHDDDHPPPRVEPTHHGPSFRRKPRRTSDAARANAPGPTRRRAISGTKSTATRPTSQGQMSTAIRDCRRDFKKASAGFSSGPPPVSSASSRSRVSSTPRSRSS